MHQSITAFLSQTIWPRWASRQFITLSIVHTLLPVTFSYSLSSEAVVMKQLRRWKRLWRRSLTRQHKRTSMGPSGSYWNSTTSALHPEEITLKRTRVSCVLSIKVSIRKKSGNLSYAPRIYCHPQTDCFVVSQLFSVAKRSRFFKQGLKPDWLLRQLVILHSEVPVV